MASRSRRGGGGGGANPKFMKGIWFLAIAALIVAFFQVPYDPGAKGIIEILTSKSQTVQKWTEGIAPAFDSFIKGIIEGGDDAPPVNPGTTEPGTSPASSGTTSEANSKLKSLKIANASGTSYDRDDWKHWSNVRSCWDTREEALSVEAVKGSLVLKDSSGKTTKDIKSACGIVSGKWNDPYTGETFTNPTDLDLDHMIPLNYASQHGGSNWNEDKKEKYANNLSYANHLVAVDKGANRSKSDRGPSEWKPSNKAYWCTYAKDWVNISATWDLSTTKADASALKDMLATCK